MENRKEIHFLKPHLKDVVWGGTKLRDEFGYAGAGDSTGECWGISAHPYGDCEVLTKEFQGMTLSKLYETHRELFGNLTEEQFPLLVKILDAKSDLSIQVHPDNAYARLHEHYPYGKTETWYIMDCPEDATLVVGHHAQTKKELEDMIYAGRYRELIKQVPVRKGDVIRIVSGTVHAIKGGFTLYELQQSSDITYRVYDYDRLTDGKKRPLHVKQSIEVINVPDLAGEAAVTHTDSLAVNTPNLLTENEFYRLWKLDVAEKAEIQQEYPFLLASVLDGKGCVDGTPVKKGDHFFFPSGYGEAVFTGKLEVMLCTVA